MAGERDDIGDGGDGTGRALRALAHPLAVASLVLLGLNDHVLKQAWPGFVTGKLSDVAGLVVAPLVLAVLLAALGVRRPDVVAVLLTGAGFVAVKTTEAGAALASETWTAVAGTSYLRSDPSDLLALPALLVALRVHRLAGRTRPPLRQRALGAVGAVVLPFAVLASAATSPCDDGSSPRDIVVLDGAWPDGSGGWERDRRLAYDHGWYELRLTGAGVVVRRLTEAEHARVGDLTAVDSVNAACDPEHPRMCWRSTRPEVSPDEQPDPTEVDEVVVQSSADGGETWSDEVVLDVAAVTRLRDAAGEVCGRPLRLNPGPLAVLPTDAGGPVLAFTMERAGVAVRDGDGTWSLVPEDTIRAADERARAEETRRPGAEVRKPRWVRRHPLRPVPQVVPPLPGEERTGSGTPDPSPPGPPCEDPVVVTVTPDPRNGPASTQLRCPPSSTPR